MEGNFLLLSKMGAFYYINDTLGEWTEGPNTDEGFSAFQNLIALFRNGTWDINDNIIAVEEVINDNDVPGFTTQDDLEDLIHVFNDFRRQRTGTDDEIIPVEVKGYYIEDDYQEDEHLLPYSSIPDRSLAPIIHARDLPPRTIPVRTGRALPVRMNRLSAI